MFHGLRTQNCPRIPRGMRRADKVCCMWAVPPARTTNSPTTGTAATFTSTLDDQPSSDRSHLFRDIPFSRLSCPIPKCPYKLLTLACGHHYMCSCFLKATHVNTFIPYCSHRQAPHLCESGLATQSCDIQPFLVPVGSTFSSIRISTAYCTRRRRVIKSLESSNPMRPQSSNPTQLVGCLVRARRLAVIST
jgi:hypothetical protein